MCAKSRRSVENKRVVRTEERVPRVVRLRGSAGRRTTNICSRGMQPACWRGSAVTRMLQSSLRRQRTWVSHVAGSTQGESATATMMSKMVSGTIPIAKFARSSGNVESLVRDCDDSGTRW